MVEVVLLQGSYRNLQGCETLWGWGAQCGSQAFLTQATYRNSALLFCWVLLSWGCIYRLFTASWVQGGLLQCGLYSGPWQSCEGATVTLGSSLSPSLWTSSNSYWERTALSGGILRPCLTTFPSCSCRSIPPSASESCLHPVAWAWGCPFSLAGWSLRGGIPP